MNRYFKLLLLLVLPIVTFGQKFRQEIQDYVSVASLRNETLAPRKNDKAYIQTTKHLYAYDNGNTTSIDDGLNYIVQTLGSHRWKCLNCHLHVELSQDSILLQYDDNNILVSRDTIRLSKDTTYQSYLPLIQLDDTIGYENITYHGNVEVDRDSFYLTKWYEKRICLNTATPSFTPANPLMPTLAEVQAWVTANLPEKDRLNGTHVVYFIAGQGGDCDNPDYTWVLNQGSELITRTQNSILTLPNYTALRNLNNYNHDIVIVDDWTYTGPDGNTYTTLGGVFKRIHPSMGRTITENGGTTFIGLDGSQWERDWDKIHVHPEWWECGGYDRFGKLYVSKNQSGTWLPGHIDGIYSESDRLDNAARFIIENNIQGVVELQKRTYLVDKQIAFASTNGNGATIRTNRPPTTTNTVAYTSGQNTITVADASQYRVGQSVLLTNSATPNGGIAYTENITGNGLSSYTIINIVGNVITLTSSGSVSVAAGNIFASTPSLGSIDRSVSINNVNFDGQYDTNTNTLDWRYTGFLGNGADEVTKAGQYGATFHQCRFDNILGSAFTGSSFELLNCYADNLGGGILHYQGGLFNSNDIYQFVRVDGLQASNVVKINPFLSNHQDALFTFSTNARNVQLTNISVTGLKGAIFGNATILDDQTFELSNSTFEGEVPSWASSTNPHLIGSISVGFADVVSSEDLQRSYRITDCSFNTCGDLRVSSERLEKMPAANIYISGCKFNNSRIYAFGVSNINITNNTFTNIPFKNFTGYTYQTSFSGSFQSTAQIAANWCDRVNISNNFIEGLETYNQHCDYGIQTQLKKVFRKDAAGINSKIWYCSNIKIKNNTILRYSFGIGHLQRFDDVLSGWNAGHSTWGNGTHIGNEISGNVIAFHKNTQYSSTFRPIWGIFALQGTIVENNTIYHPLNSPTNVLRHIMMWGTNDAEKANIFGGIVRNNTIWSPSSFINVIIGTGSGGDDMEDNILVQGNSTMGTVYSTKGYQSNNYRIQANAFPHLTNPYMNPDLQGFIQNASQY